MPAAAAIGLLAVLAVSAAPGKAPPPAAGPDFVFRDAAVAAGLRPGIEGIYGHAAAWGDVDGDGWPDLFVGTFHKLNKAGSKPDLLFRNANAKLRLDEQKCLRVSGRTSGAVFADFDNDGDLDLYVSNFAGGKAGEALTPSALFRNDGGGAFTDASKDSGACPAGFGGRSVALLDFDGDGLLDLLVGEDPLIRSRGTRLFRNKGELRFEDRTAAAGLPERATALGAAAGDADGDGWPDVLLAGRGSDRLFLNDGRGRFREWSGSGKAFAWTYGNADDTACGAAFGDVNRDGRLDIVVGQHFDSPWRSPVPVRLYLNRGAKGGEPEFEEITEAAGLRGLPMKAPHVEIQDFDNDGWPDLFASVVKFAGGEPYPLIYKNLGVRDGLPRFRERAWAVNDFPAEADRRGGRGFYEKMLADKKILYYPAAPSCDYDLDGRLDIAAASWWPESPSMLLRNETPSGNWLSVRLDCKNGVNRMGVGAAVRVYAEGRIGDESALLGFQPIAAGYGFSSGQEALAHFGLGEASECDVEVLLPCGKGRIEKKGVKANQRLTLGD